MFLGRSSKSLGVLVVAVLALGACAGNGNNEDSLPLSGGAVAVAEATQFTSFNSDSATGNVDINKKVSYLTHSNFHYVNAQLEIVPNEDFGTYKVTSQNPLTVEYTINEGVAWSDGEPIDAGDLLLSWAVQSGYFDDENIEEETGSTYFTYAGEKSGLGLTSLPKVTRDGRGISLTYSEPYADYETAFRILDTPAHVVATGGGLADEEALVELIRSAPAGDPEDPKDRPALRKVAKYWNTAFDTNTLPSDLSLSLSSGPYIVHDMVPGRSMVLVRNEDYTWGPMPSLDEITIRYIPDANVQVQALKDGDVDIIQPETSSDTMASLEAIDGVQILKGEEASFAHIDLSHSGHFENDNIRRAFMYTVPRNSIVETVVGPLDAKAEPRNSHIFAIGTDGYDAAVRLNGSKEFTEPDIEQAKELLAGASPEVRITYNADNPNYVAVYALIAESAEQAGFSVVDGGLGSEKWGAALGGGSYDATIFDWSISGVGVSSVPQRYGCDSPSNFNDFCDEKAQTAMDKLLTTIDSAERQRLQFVVDSRLFETGYGLPLFQPIGVNAADKRIRHVTFSPTPMGVWWNFWDWSIA